MLDKAKHKESLVEKRRFCMALACPLFSCLSPYHNLHARQEHFVFAHTFKRCRKPEKGFGPSQQCQMQGTTTNGEELAVGPARGAIARQLACFPALRLALRYPVMQQLDGRCVVAGGCRVYRQVCVGARANCAGDARAAVASPLSGMLPVTGSFNMFSSEVVEKSFGKLQGRLFRLGRGTRT